MNGMLQKWLLILFLIPILILLLINRVEGLHARQVQSGSIVAVREIPYPHYHAGNGIIMPRAHVYHNRKGLKDDIEVIEPLRELNAIAHSDKQSIEELIDDITFWIPKIYYRRFLVYPECIIVLETKINDEGRAEVRFGLAMECAHKAKLANPITI
jgi:hypothetical protein